MSWTISPIASPSLPAERGRPRTHKPVERLHVSVADTWWRRARGLLRRPSPGPGEGMLFPGCSSVHTWFMGYPIDVVYLDRACVVTKVAPAVRPWRFSAGNRATRYVLELAAGEASRLQLEPGARVDFDSGPAGTGGRDDEV